MRHAVTKARLAAKRMTATLLPTMLSAAALMATTLFAITVGGCDSDAPAPVTRLEGTLSLEVRDEAAIVIEPDGALPWLRVSITPSAGFDLLSAGQPLEGKGLLTKLPEASGRLYTAKLQAPAQPGGPCGEQPISLALSLHRQLDNAMVIGGLTAYCGQERWFGNPVRVLRLAGPLPLPSPEAP